MNAFRFPLERVLAWRRTQLEVEENRYLQELAALAALQDRMAGLATAGESAETAVRTWNPVAGLELESLGRYRLHLKAEAFRLKMDEDEARRRVAFRQASMLEARRRLRLLENLKARQYAAWKADCDRELEQIAAESYLSRWSAAALPGVSAAAGEACDTNSS
jgi:hypothetical protein